MIGSNFEADAPGPGGRRPRAALVAVLLLAAGCAPPDEPAVLRGAPPMQMVVEGARIFQAPEGCGVCHGADGRGARGVGADLTDATWWHTDGSRSGIAARIRAGVPADSARNGWGAAMPPRGGRALTDREVEAVAAYVWTLGRVARRAYAHSGGAP